VRTSLRGAYDDYFALSDKRANCALRAVDYLLNRSEDSAANLTGVGSGLGSAPTSPPRSVRPGEEDRDCEKREPENPDRMPTVRRHRVAQLRLRWAKHLAVAHWVRACLAAANAGADRWDIQAEFGDDGVHFLQGAAGKPLRAAIALRLRELEPEPPGLENIFFSNRSAAEVDAHNREVRRRARQGSKESGQPPEAVMVTTVVTRCGRERRLSCSSRTRGSRRCHSRSHSRGGDSGDDPGGEPEPETGPLDELTVRESGR
jgi:hypothetical protein